MALSFQQFFKEKLHRAHELSPNIAFLVLFKPQNLNIRDYIKHIFSIFELIKFDIGVKLFLIKTMILIATIGLHKNTTQAYLFHSSDENRNYNRVRISGQNLNSHSGHNWSRKSTKL